MQKGCILVFEPIFIFCRIEQIFGRLSLRSTEIVYAKKKFCVKRHLYEQIFRRWILTQGELKLMITFRSFDSMSF